ncbi:MAG: AraC family transcriptional regulator [Zhongshania sp.]|uniref:AraC family transcriptional regulator n=1 Tax=Zhongshania sp. TaxID=1971902 RepID=UPI002621D929|nr:AraC family transcriptional regulator [Zhongshania sp.]MDF1693150.1 AraC family transcriptional regulator [Zhongshania sp.]
MRPLIRSSSLSGYQELVRELGADPTPFISQLNLDPKRLGDFDYLIFYHHLMQILENSAVELNCPDFGLQLSKKQNLETLGPIAIMARASNTVRDAMLCVARYISYHSPALKLSLDDKTAPNFPRLIVEIDVPDLPYRRQTIELAMGLTANVHGLLTEYRYKPDAILFRHTRELDINRYRRHFGCPVLFGQETNALVLTPEQFNLPIRTANTFQREMMTNYVAKKSRTNPVTLFEQTRFIVSRLLPTQHCNIKSVAEELFMHPRTLQRRLKSEGHIFEQVLDDIRRTEAQSFLAEQRMPMAQIAGLLGYQEQSSFNRAVKRWFGVTPNSYRKSFQNRQIPPQ